MNRLNDPFWAYALKESDGRSTCIFCGQTFAATTPITRFKFHLSGIEGRGVRNCTKVPKDVQEDAFLACQGPNKRPKTMPSSSNINVASPQAQSNEIVNLTSSIVADEMITELLQGNERNVPFAEVGNHIEDFNRETTQTIRRSIVPEWVPVDEHETRVLVQNNEDLGTQQEVGEERIFSVAEAGILVENRAGETSQPIHRSITPERPPVGDECEAIAAATQLLADEVGPVIENSWDAIHASMSIRNGGPIPTALQAQNDEVAEADLFDALQPLFVKLRQKWEERLLQINAILDDVEHKLHTSKVMEIWFGKLRDLAYDVEDILDEFETEDLKSKLKSGESQASTSTVQPSAAMPTRSNLQEIDARWEDTMKERNDLGLDINTRGSYNKVIRKVQTTSLVKEAKVYGRENAKEDLIQLLIKDEPSHSRYSVIPVVGMGGIGKTTLTQFVYNDERLKFDYKAWVCVSDDFDITRLTKSILRERLETEDLNELQEKLMEKLHGKKFFIVLDDVWQHSYEDWTALCSPFATGAPGSKIIITTRGMDVALRICSVDPYTLKELPYGECLCLFAQHALEEENFEAHPDLEEVGQKIVQRCKGLPLAAKTLGGLLRHKQNLEDWEDILNSEMWELSEGESVILSALKLSYIHLPSYLKRCFAYCAIFPKDYKFNENELVLLWMAEGFLQKRKQKKQQKDLGHKYFKDLLSRSLFQEYGTDSKSGYVMHDLISDLAQSVSEEICIYLDDKKSSGATSYAKVRHFSFTSHRYGTLQRFKACYGMESLRTFLTIPNSLLRFGGYLSTKVLDDLIPKLKCLRALSLASYTLRKLPESIGALKLLRYLNLSNTAIVRLPVSLGNLLNLQTLILRGCDKLVELPASIGDLFNLQHLDVRGTDSLKEMPREITKLKNLHFLPKFIVGEGNGLGIGELMRLPHLQGELCIAGLQNVTNIQDAMLANLKERKGLGELALEWSNNFHDVRNESREKQVLTSLQPHQSLEKLSINSYGGINFPLWVGDPTFSKMVSLELSGCRKSTSLPSLGKLPALMHLRIRGMDKLRGMAVEDFPSLETLNIGDMREWERWYWSDGLNEEPGGKFPKLVGLTLENCPKLIGKLPRCLPSLKKLHISRCGKLINLPEMLPSLFELKVEGCHEVIFQMVPDFTSLTRFEIRRISGLVSLHDALVEALVALEDLVIEKCYELKYLWQDSVDSNKLANLKQLQISSCEQLQLLVEGEEGLLPCNLQVLSLIKCHNLKKLPNGLHCQVSFPEGAGLPYTLKSLVIRSCDSLESLPDGIMTMMNGNDNSSQCSLEELVIYDCPSLKSFPKGKLPTTLKKLSIVGVEKLESEYWFLQEIMQCDGHLDDLWVRNFCITSFPNVQFPTSLKKLKIYDCQKIKSLPSLLNLFCLTHLEIVDCTELESFLDQELPLPNLISLRISSCYKLRSLPNHMDSIQALEISCCWGLVSFPETGFPPKLTSLQVTQCKNLRQSISEWRLHTLTCLKHLEINFEGPCITDVDYFPDEDGLLLPTSLTSLVIFCHENLKSISRGIQHLRFLKRLTICGCPKLHILPKEGFPETLGCLDTSRCPLLKKEDHWSILAHIPLVLIF